MPKFCCTPILLLFLYRVSYFSPALAGSVTEGGLCSTNNDHLDPITQKFFSECGPKDFCSDGSNGTCIPRRCRRDEFPFGYAPTEVVPALCPLGTFCPDEGSGCSPSIGPGGTCQLGRDEQCSPPSNWLELSSSHNFNGSICLQSKCM